MQHLLLFNTFKTLTEYIKYMGILLHQFFKEKVIITAVAFDKLL